jgi:hypothetical protein
MHYLHRHLLPIGLTIAVALAGCGDSDTERGNAMATAGKLEGFVLTKTDLPSGYALEDASRASSRNSCLEDRERSVRRKLASLGLQRCSAATFRKEVDLGGGDGRINTADSVALLMRTDTAASHALRARRKEIVSYGRSLGDVHSVPAPRLGDEAPRGVATDFGNGTLFVYTWRRGSVVATLSSTSTLGDFDQRKTLELARKLDARGAG